MALGEFELIRQFFSDVGKAGSSVVLGVGDDCALLDLSPGHQLAVTTDTLVEGVHFPRDCDPALLARRSLRVNLSDLAAMGAEPLAFQLALTLPRVNEAWLSAFSAGLASDAKRFTCRLTGGDTTRGPLTITLTLLGQVPHDKALQRNKARSEDLIYVTGTLGDSRGGLEAINRNLPDQEFLKTRYWLPEPRLAAGVLLREYASAALDISDGLLQDAGHLAMQSGVQAEIWMNAVPLSNQLIQQVGQEQASSWALVAGDDYELCFTVPPENVPAIEQAFSTLQLPINCVGKMKTGAPGIVCLDAEGNQVALGDKGYAHF